VEFNSFDSAVGRLGSDSGRGGGKVEAGGLSPHCPPHFNHWCHSYPVGNFIQIGISNPSVDPKPNFLYHAYGWLAKIYGCVSAEPKNIGNVLFG